MVSATVPQPATSVEPAITIAGVGKTFDHGSRSVRALHRFDLRVRPREFVTLIGPSGCGKSTLLRVVGGLLDADEGSVVVAGSTPSAGRREKLFGFVPQTPALLPWRSVRDNVRLLPQLNRRRGRAPLADDEVDRLLEAVGLAPFADALPEQLSGGMQQRVSLIRAFALHPPILLMDEPFAALDEIIRYQMRYQLLELWQSAQATVLFVTHSIPEAVVLSDRVVIMGQRPGRVLAIEEIELERPRQAEVEDDPRFHAHCSAIRRALLSGFG
jgi:NitT/TauT family transport system ATP-binding protein